MKSALLLIPLLFFMTSCTLIPEPDSDLHIQALESEIATLKAENTKLQEELTLIQTESVSRDFSRVNSDSSAMPPGTTFEETSPNDECYKKAADAFLEAGNKQCLQQGLSQEDIKNKKCKLPTELVKALSEKRTKDELACGPS